MTKSDGGEENSLQRLVQIADKRVEVITLGNSSVGNTQLLSRFANNTFEEASESTIGVDFYYRNVKVESESEKDSFEMLVKCWDTAGQECFKFAMKQYFRGRQGCLFVFAVDDYESFKESQRMDLKSQRVESRRTFPFVECISHTHTHTHTNTHTQHTHTSGVFNYCGK